MAFMKHCSVYLFIHDTCLTSHSRCELLQCGRVITNMTIWLNGVQPKESRWQNLLAPIGSWSIQHENVLEKTKVKENKILKTFAQIL